MQAACFFVSGGMYSGSRLVSIAFANPTLWVMMYLGENLTATGSHGLKTNWGSEVE